MKVSSHKNVQVFTSLPPKNVKLPFPLHTYLSSKDYLRQRAACNELISQFRELVSVASVRRERTIRGIQSTFQFHCPPTSIKSGLSVMSSRITVLILLFVSSLRRPLSFLLNGLVCFVRWPGCIQIVLQI